VNDEANHNTTLPTAEQMENHLQQHAAQAPNPWFTRLPLIALIAIGMLLFVGDTWLALTLPWVVLLGLFATMHLRARHVQKLERAVTRCQELAMRRYYHRALKQGWQLLPRLTRQPQMRHRVIAVLGDCLGDLACYEPALVVYDHLLEEVPEDHPAADQLQALRALAAFGSDRLTDGDDALRQLRKQIDPDQSTPVSAAYHLAELLQAIRTHHYAEATEAGQAYIERLRPLGVEAGFGHALLAWSHYQQAKRAQPVETSPSPEPADAGQPASGEHPPARDDWQWMRWWWQNAILLVSPAAIVFRFPELKPLVEEARQ
jgi:tetratricopeptide (TPR) repeat protein